MHGYIFTIEIKENEMAVKRRKRKNRARKKILLLVFELLLLAVILGSLWVFSKTLGAATQTDSIDDGEAGINKDIDEKSLAAQEGYTNIALFGIDNRETGQYGSGNADTIMIASIDNSTKEVRLVSIYRDTYLDVDGAGNYHKANSAYSVGGALGTIQMLNNNLDLTLTQYVSVDWAALVDAIDALGGLDLEITDGEVAGINKYLRDVDKATGKSTPLVTQSGLVHLDGSQATTYARLRKGLGDDYKRTSRQRIVLQEMLNKAKESDIATLTSICEAVFKHVETNIPLTQMLQMITDVSKYEIVETTGFPSVQSTMMISKEDCVVPATLSSNVEELHQFLFAGEDYTVSQTVQTLSDNISYLTGVTENSSLVDTSGGSDTAGKNGTDVQTESETSSQTSSQTNLTN